jgi:hypothetical protein
MKSLSPANLQKHHARAPRIIGAGWYVVRPPSKMRISILLLAWVAALGSIPSAQAQFSKEWLTQYGKDGDLASGIATDAQGRSWVAGSVIPSGGTADTTLSRFSTSGTLEFTRVRGGALDDYGRSVAIVGSNTVFVGGSTNSNAFDGQPRLGTVDALLVRFDRAGTWQQTSRFGGTDVQEIRTSAGSASHGLFAGTTRSNLFEGQTNAGGYDAFLTKRDSTGAPIWTRLAGTAGNEFSDATAFDASGNALMAGTTDSSFNGFTNAGGDTDLFIARYDSGGLLTWLKQFGTAGYETPTDMEVDATGNIYLCGQTSGPYGGQPNLGGADGFVMKLDSNGNIIRSHLFGGVGDDYIGGLGLDGRGHLLVAGSSQSSISGHQNLGGFDAVLAAYNTDGALLGSTSIGTASDDFVSDLAIGPDGNAYVVGLTGGLLDPKATQPGLFAAEFALVPEPSSAIATVLGGAAFLRRHRRCGEQ